MKFLLVFLIILMTIGINLPDGMLANLGLDPDWLMAALAAWLLAALVIHRRMALIVLVVFMSLMVNLPVDLGIDKDVLLGAMVAVLVTPFIALRFL